MPQSKAIVTSVNQYDVIVLEPQNWKGYERNRPAPNWELVEYVGVKDGDGKPVRHWVPNYTLKVPKIRNFSKIKIVVPEEAK